MPIGYLRIASIALALRESGGLPLGKIVKDVINLANHRKLRPNSEFLLNYLRIHLLCRC